MYNDLIKNNIEYFKNVNDFMYNYFNTTNKDDFINDFNDMLDRGIIEKFTCGTYNGALNKFDTWTINNKNIINTILNYIKDTDYINTMSDYMESYFNNIYNDTYIYELLKIFFELNKVFIIKNNVYTTTDF